MMRPDKLQNYFKISPKINDNSIVLHSTKLKNEFVRITPRIVSSTNIFCTPSNRDRECIFYANFSYIEQWNLFKFGHYVTLMYCIVMYCNVMYCNVIFMAYRFLKPLIYSESCV